MKLYETISNKFPSCLYEDEGKENLLFQFHFCIISILFINTKLVWYTLASQPFIVGEIFYDHKNAPFPLCRTLFDTVIVLLRDFPFKIQIWEKKFLMICPNNLSKQTSSLQNYENDVVRWLHHLLDLTYTVQGPPNTSHYMPINCSLSQSILASLIIIWNEADI